MNGKPKDNHRDNVSASGGGKVSVSVKDIVNSPKVQQQVKAVKELADSLSKKVA